MRCPKAFASLMALTLALSLGLTACMGSPREAGSAPVSEGVAQEKTAGRVGQETDEEEADPENVDPDEVIADEARQWSDAWMGELGTGERCLYARSPDGSEAIMVVYDARTNRYVAFAGSNATDAAGGRTILTDEASTLTLAYEVTDARDDTVTLDLGAYGTARLASCDADDVIGAFVAVYDGGSDALAAAGDAASLERGLRLLTHGWAGAWMGEGTGGKRYYVARAGSTDDALVLIVDPKSDEYASFVGTTYFDEETLTTSTTDDSSGATITYRLVDDTDGGLTIDAGEYGTASLAAATMDDLIEAFVANAENRTPVN